MKKRTTKYREKSEIFVLRQVTLVALPWAVRNHDNELFKKYLRYIKEYFRGYFGGYLRGTLRGTSVGGGGRGGAAISTVR